MRKRKLKNRGILAINESYEGNSLEMQIADRMSGINIELGGKALLYTERKDGVLPQTDIRTDRFDIAMMAYKSVEDARIAQRDNAIKKQQEIAESKSHTAPDA